MKNHLKYYYIVALLCLVNLGKSQCFVDFDFDDSSLVVSFEDLSLHAINDSIILYNWDFGDNTSSSTASPIHIYAQSGEYDVTLMINTELGCSESVTKSIYICDFNLDYDLQIGCDEDNKVSLDLHILDTYSSAGELNVFLDGMLLNENALTTINDTVSISTELLADGLEHSIDIQSISYPSCFLSETIEVTPCVPPCYLSDLKTEITNTTTVNVTVEESGYDPIVLNVNTGDTIVYNWATEDKSVTSNPNNNGQDWDSGIRNIGDEYKLYSFAPGIFTYTSSNTLNGAFEGSLVSTCPDSAYYDLLLTFKNQEQIGTYDLWVDGVPSQIMNIPYNVDGFDTIQLTLPGDGVMHTYEILDSDSPSCNLFTSVQAPLCGITSECNLFVSASQTTPCNQDSLVDITFTILSAGGGDNGFDLYIDEELYESNIAYTGTETNITRSLFGDGEEHSIRIVDTTQDTCESTTNILLEDCSQPCIILNTFAGVGSNKSFVINVLDDTFLPKDITISAGDKAIWQWQTDTLRSVTSIDFLFDSGVKGTGEAFVSPVLPIGVYRYFSEFNGMEGSITVNPNCEGSLIPIVYNFNKFGGANTGYNVYVDSIKVNGAPILYAENGNNTGNSFVPGNGELHLVQIVDAVDTTCNASQSFEVPFCDASTCALFLENPAISDCKENNTIDLSLDLLAFNPSDSIFYVSINGLSTDTLKYDTSGITSLDFILPGTGILYDIVVQDRSEEFCSSSFSFTAPLCDNPCAFDYISVDYQMETTEDSCFDGSVQLIVNTQAIHNFNSDYTISLTSDNININQVHNYPSDGLLSHVFNLPANGELLNIAFTNNLNESCIRDTSFNILNCAPDPCSVNLTDISYSDCRDGGLMDMILEIDTFRISDSLSILLDDEEVFKGTYADFYISPQIEITYTGEERKLNLIDIGNSDCVSEDHFFTQFCPTECILEASYMLSDSCIFAEDSTYNILLTGSVLNAVSDSILVELVSSNITSHYSYTQLTEGITLTISRTDDNPTLGIFDLEDDSCRNFLGIDPPSCILDCNINIDSTEVLEMNCINGTRSISFYLSYGYQDADSIDLTIDGELVHTIEYPLDSILTTTIIGDGLIHNIIIHDSSNEMCADTLDLLVEACAFSCVDFLVDFDYSIDSLTNTVTYNDLTTGSADQWNWDLGDNTVSSDANPFHTYSDFGTYTICLTAENEIEGCIQSICKEIELVDINCNADYNFTVDGLTITFESISTSDEIIQSIGWFIDGEKILDNAFNGTYNANNAETVEFCLYIETTSDCMSTICETIELVDPCNIIPTYDTTISFDTIQLQNTSIGNYSTTSWTFGDGFTFSGDEVEYIYPQDGDYEVCMTVSNSELEDCEFTICEMININSCEANALFLIDINQDTLNAELVIPLNDLDISWDFGNGFSANINPIQFVYTEVGDYTICATVTDNNLDNCSDTDCQDISITITGIDINVLSEIEVYPNPIQIGENVRIVNAERLDLTIELYSSAGQKIATRATNHGDQYTLSTASLSAGKYLVKISTLEESIVKSIILID